eukprot:GHVU01071768.1.p1 GENE.GHVU01071768.1~~GHVU01071768.1.p1  ORF type:complete len:233 (-),score=62.28 GHVU01071768.1:288-986(-)
MCETTFLARQSDGLILCETWEGSNASTDLLQYLRSQAKWVLTQLSGATQPCSIRVSPTQDYTDYFFHYLARDGVVFLTTTAGSYPKKLAFSFLEDVARMFENELQREFGSYSADYRSHIETIDKPYYFIKFDRAIKKKQDEVMDPHSKTALQKLNESLVEVTDLMQKNLSEIVGRGEQIDDVSRKAQDLKMDSKAFAGVAKKISFRAMLEHYLPYGVFLAVVLFIVLWKLYF